MSWATTQKEILKNSELLLRGTILSLDPSSGGGQSQPGYAIYRAGELVDSGILSVSGIRQLHKRLKIIQVLIEKIISENGIQIVVLEHIKRVRGQFSGASVDTLFKGVGAMLAACSAVDSIIEIPPSIWKRSVDTAYLKSDEADAIYLGRFAILHASFQVKTREARKIKTLRPVLSNRKVNLAAVKTKRPKKSKGKRKCK